jgi:hypothetical protein
LEHHEGEWLFMLQSSLIEGRSWTSIAAPLPNAQWVINTLDQHFGSTSVSCARQDLKSSQAYPRGFAEALQTVIGDNLHEIRSTQHELQISAACITMKRDDVFDMGSTATAHDKWFDANLHGVFQQLLAHRK